MSVQINARIPDELYDRMLEYIDGYEIRDKSQFVVLALKSYVDYLDEAYEEDMEDEDER